MSRAFLCLQPLIVLWSIAFIIHILPKGTYWYSVPLAITFAVFTIVSIFIAMFAIIDGDDL